MVPVSVTSGKARHPLCPRRTAEPMASRILHNPSWRGSRLSDLIGTAPLPTERGRVRTVTCDRHDHPHFHCDTCIPATLMLNRCWWPVQHRPRWTTDSFGLWGRVPDWRIAGVYALFSRDGDLEYIGQSRDVQSRLLAHRKRLYPGVQAVCIRVGNPVIRKHIEADLLWCLRPQYNFQFPAWRPAAPGW